MQIEMNELLYEVVDTHQNPDSAVIWLHGLGANGHDFVPIVPELALPDDLKVRFIFPHATPIPVTVNGGAVMPAWYDILSMSIEREIDIDQIQGASKRIHHILNNLVTEGMDSKKIILAGAISALTALSAQADYQFEANVGYLQGDIENLDFDGFALAATIYFDTVDTSKGPLSEAAFLSKSSSISLSNSNTTLDDIDLDVTDTTDIVGRFVFSNDFILEISYSDEDNDIAEDSAIAVGIGKYLSDSDEIIFSIETTDESEIDSLGIDYHSLNDLAGSASISYDLGASYIDAADDSGFGLLGGLTYYPSTQLALAAEVDYLSVGDIDVTIFSVGAEYFFNENIAGSIAYSTSDTDVDDDFNDASGTVDTVALTLTARF